MWPRTNSMSSVLAPVGMVDRSSIRIICWRMASTAAKGDGSAINRCAQTWLSKKLCSVSSAYSRASSGVIESSMGCVATPMVPKPGRGRHASVRAEAA
jgi:hypothetical protein